jgi:RNA polymerase sigma factor (sigma-70 family)
MADYRLTARIRNNRILKRMEAAGFDTTADFCRAYGMEASHVSAFITMRWPAVDKHGAWKPAAVNLADALGCNPEDLFNERQQVADFDAVVTHREIDEPPMMSIDEREVLALPADDARDYREMARVALKAGLTGREREVLKRRFGMDGPEETFAQVGEHMGVSKERVRQIEARALRRMRGHLYRAGVGSLH